MESSNILTLPTPAPVPMSPEQDARLPVSEGEYQLEYAKAEADRLMVRIAEIDAEARERRDHAKRARAAEREALDRLRDERTELTTVVAGLNGYMTVLAKVTPTR